MKLEGKKTYIAAIIWALLPILMQFLGIDAGGFVGDGGSVLSATLENSVMAGGLSALRAGVAKG